MAIKRTILAHCLVALALLSAGACRQKDDSANGNANDGMDAPMSMTMTSTAFNANETIPVQYTGDGDNVSPPLAWSNVPDSAVELALIVDDPDAPTDEPFVHWVIYKIPAGSDGLPENVPRDAELSDPAGALQGENGFGSVGFRGPAPPPRGGPHRYIFKLYALSDALDVQSGLTKGQLLDAMEGKVLATAELVGNYER